MNFGQDCIITASKPTSIFSSCAIALQRARLNHDMQGLSALQPRFFKWLGQLGGAADILLMGHPLLQAADPAIKKGDHIAGFDNGTWRGMEDLIGFQVHIEGSGAAMTIWLDGVLPQVLISVVGFDLMRPSQALQ